MLYLITLLYVWICCNKIAKAISIDMDCPKVDVSLKEAKKYLPFGYHNATLFCEWLSARMHISVKASDVAVGIGLWKYNQLCENSGIIKRSVVNSAIKCYVPPQKRRKITMIEASKIKHPEDVSKYTMLCNTWSGARKDMAISLLSDLFHNEYLCQYVFRTDDYRKSYLKKYIGNILPEC